MPGSPSDHPFLTGEGYGTDRVGASVGAADEPDLVAGPLQSRLFIDSPLRPSPYEYFESRFTS